MPRGPGFAVAVLLAVLATASCGGDDAGESAPLTVEVPTEVLWVAGQASATLIVDGRDLATFEGGTCEPDRGAFRLRAGTPGADGEGILVLLAVDLHPGASVAGDGSGNGVQVDHAGTRWRLSGGPKALVFDDDLRGGTIRLFEEGADDGGPGNATVRFRC